MAESVLSDREKERLRQVESQIKVTTSNAGTASAVVTAVANERSKAKQVTRNSSYLFLFI